MKFLLTMLKIFYILDPTLALLSEPKENDMPNVAVARKKREEDELICMGHILNALSDKLYDLYTSTNSVRDIWEALEKSTKLRKKVLKISLFFNTLISNFLMKCLSYHKFMSCK